MVKKILKSKRGEVTIQTVAILLIAMLVIAFAINVIPVLIAKQQLNTYASELCREAALVGKVGDETTTKSQKLSEQTGIQPEIIWSKTGKIQLDNEITVTVKTTKNIGFFTFASYPIEITAKSTNRSEVYWK